MKCNYKKGFTPVYLFGLVFFLGAIFAVLPEKVFAKVCVFADPRHNNEVTCVDIAALRARDTGGEVPAGITTLEDSHCHALFSRIPLTWSDGSQSTAEAAGARLEIQDGDVCSQSSGPENTSVPSSSASSTENAGGGGAAESLIEPCALQNPGSGGYCNDVNDLLSQLIRIARFLFGIIGSLALLFFVFGGMTMILSFGSSEKFKSGRDMMVAAVIGMMISFSAYIVINFVLTALGVTSDFRGI